MRMPDLISNKKNNIEHTKQEIDYIISGYVSGQIPDYQMSAWMMAVCFNGMTDIETSALTMAMAYSGSTMDLSGIDGIIVDKHSTGGVGDTTTLIVAPLVAACGAPVAKMSGRGLGHTGGTLDKLESVPGVNVDISVEDFIRIVQKHGICVMGQTADLVPADKLMYALRDVTGTVESVPLIASSIMSKKIAAGAQGIVLDVKTGSGAFMDTPEKARVLASTMVNIGKSAGRKTVAVISDMNQPLGMAVGNGLEMKEAVEALTGRIPLNSPLCSVSIMLAGEMLLLSGVADSIESAKKMVIDALNNGSGYKKLEQMICALGGDPEHLRNPEMLVNVKQKIDIKAEQGGYIGAINAQLVGSAAQMLGAGREKKNDIIDPQVGLIMKKRIGMRVEKGDVLATLYVNSEKRLEESIKSFSSALTISQAPPAEIPLIYEILKG